MLKHYDKTNNNGGSIFMWSHFFNLIGKTDFSMNQIHHTVLVTTQSSFNVVYTVQSVGSYIDILI